MNYNELQNNEYLNELFYKLDFMKQNYSYIFIVCNDKVIQDYIEHVLMKKNIIPLYIYELSNIKFLKKLNNNDILLCNLKENLNNFKQKIKNKSNKFNENDYNFFTYLAFINNKEYIKNTGHNLYIIGDETVITPLLEFHKTLGKISHFEFIDNNIKMNKQIKKIMF